MERTQVVAWVEKLRVGWESGDAAGAADLFTVDATYHNDPFRPPLRGREEIERYWSAATATQTDISVTMGLPLSDADRVAVEWWAHTVADGATTTDCGALVLTFEGTRCKDLREYWNLSENDVAPQVGWGQ
jgi:uncharacterized protein (TIGR02246 family)